MTNRVDRAAKKVDRSPSEAQIEAGNYRKGHTHVHGLPITIENPKGTERTGRGKDGSPWSVTMPAHYGYIKRTDGADGDHVDAYVGDDHKSRHVTLVDQVDPDTRKFDEHKALLGFADGGSALDAYHSGFSDNRGHERVGAATHMDVDEFKNWLEKGNTKKPHGRLTRFKRGGAVEHKASKGAAEYRAHPSGGDRCGKCTMFRPPHGCTAVDGSVTQMGWCKYFEAKAGYAGGGKVTKDDDQITPGNRIPTSKDTIEWMAKRYDSLPEGLHTPAMDKLNDPAAAVRNTMPNELVIHPKYQTSYAEGGEVPHFADGGIDYSTLTSPRQNYGSAPGLPPPSDDSDVDTGDTTNAGALARTAGRSAVTAVGSLPAIGAGAFYGAEAGSVAGPVGGLVGGFIGGVAGGLGGGALVTKARDWAADMLGVDSPEQRAADVEKNKENPNAALAAELGPQVIGFSPGALGKTIAQRLAQRAIGAGAMGGLEAGSEYVQGEDLDLKRIGASALMGGVFAKPNRLGARLMGHPAYGGAEAVGEGNPVPGRPDVAADGSDAPAKAEATQGTPPKQGLGTAPIEPKPPEERSQETATLSVVGDQGRTGRWAKGYKEPTGDQPTAGEIPADVAAAVSRINPEGRTPPTYEERMQAASRGSEEAGPPTSVDTTSRTPEEAGPTAEGPTQPGPQFGRRQGPIEEKPVEGAPEPPPSEGARPSPAPEAPSQAPAPTEPVKSTRDHIHDIARELEPELFQRFDALTEARDNLRKHIDNASRMRDAEDPRRQAISELEAKLEGATPRLRKKYQTRIDELRNLDRPGAPQMTQLAGPEPADLVRLRKNLMDVDYSMREHLPDVHDAMQRAEAEFERRATEPVPEEAPKGEAPWRPAEPIKYDIGDMARLYTAWIQRQNRQPFTHDTPAPVEFGKRNLQPEAPKVQLEQGKSPVSDERLKQALGIKEAPPAPAEVEGVRQPEGPPREAGGSGGESSPRHPDSTSAESSPAGNASDGRTPTRLADVGMPWVATDPKKISREQGVARSMDDVLNTRENKRSQLVNDMIDARRELMEKHGVDEKDLEIISDAREAGKVADLPEKYRAVAEDAAKYDDMASKFRDQNEALYPGYKAQDVSEHQHRIVHGFDRRVENMKGEDVLMNNRINKNVFSTPKEKERTFMALENLNGERKIISVDEAGKNPDGFTVWNKYKSSTGATTGFDRKLGSEWVDSNGQPWIVKTASRKEIEANTLTKNQPTRYLHDALAESMMNYAHQKNVHEDLMTIRDLQQDPNWKDNTWKGTGKPPEGYEKLRGVDGTPLQGYYGTPDMAGIFEKFEHSGLNVKGLEGIRNVSRFMTKTLFWWPLPHLMNKTVHAVEYNAGSQLSSPSARRLWNTGIAAVREVLNPGQITREIEDNGGSLMWPKLKASQGMLPNVYKAYLDANLPVYKRIASFLGIPTDAIYQGSAKAMWSGGDMFYIQAYLDAKARGMSPKEAINSINKVLPTYRVPSKMFGSEALTKLSTEPALMAFGRYHFAVMNAWANIVKKIVGSEANTETRIEAAGNLMGLGVMALFAYPAISYVANKTAAMMGSESTDTESRWRGPLSVLGHMKEAYQGKDPKGFLTPLTELFMPTKLVDMVSEIRANKDWRDQHIVPPGELYEASHLNPAAAARSAGYLANYIAKNAIQPYGQFATEAASNRTAGDFVRNQLFDTKQQSEASKAWQAKNVGKMRQEADRRATKTKDKFEQMMNSLLPRR